MTTIEQEILQSLVHNEQYVRKALPHIDEEYFEQKTDRVLFRLIKSYYEKYNSLPNKTALQVELDNLTNLNENEFQEVNQKIRGLTNSDNNLEWLLDSTENFCKDRAVFLALMESVSIAQGDHKTLAKDSIPDIMRQALSVCFDTNVGHDYISDALARYDYYNAKEAKIPFPLSEFNNATKGGANRKALVCALAPSGVGKSLFMTNWASWAISHGHNVLYITMEMAEERIAERIDANLMDVTLDNLANLPRTIFEQKINKIKERSNGILKIKEYPTGTAHAGHFRGLLDELKTKQNFIPDIIFIDYLNICASQKYRAGGSANSYTIIKSVAEELRALAVETNTLVVTATQTVRSGFNNSDIDMTHTSESIGIVQTVDMLFAITDNENLRPLGQIMIKQLKSRFGDVAKKEKFLVGIDRSKMKLFDLAPDAQNNIQQTNHPYTAPVKGSNDVVDNKFKDFSF